MKGPRIDHAAAPQRSRSEASLNASEQQLYSRYKHTVSCRVEYGGETEENLWFDLDVYSNSEDPRTALVAYLRQEYGERDVVTESRDGTFAVLDPMFPDESVRRHYRLKQD